MIKIKIRKIQALTILAILCFLIGCTSHVDEKEPLFNKEPIIKDNISINLERFLICKAGTLNTNYCAKLNITGIPTKYEYIEQVMLYNNNEKKFIPFFGWGKKTREFFYDEQTPKPSINKGDVLWLIISYEENEIDRFELIKVPKRILQTCKTIGLPYESRFDCDINTIKSMPRVFVFNIEVENFLPTTTWEDLND